MSVPTGPIASKMTKGEPAGIAWEDVTRYDRDLHREADAVGWPIDRLRATIVIESRGNPRARQVNPSNGDSYGLGQVVPYGVGWAGWHTLVKEKARLGANASRARVIDALYDPAINIAVFVAIKEAFYQQHGTLDKADSAFFVGNPTWQGGDSVNGTAGWQYRDTLQTLIKEQEAFAPPDLLRIVFGGDYVISQEWAVTSSAADYGYGQGHGLNGRQHTGIDAVGHLRDPLFAPFDGTVTCAATNSGGGSWGTGCVAFQDYSDGGGAGRVEILHTDGRRSLIFGHCDTSTVRVGDRVRAGQQVGTVGSMNAPHVHLESREHVGGSAVYMIRDPRTLFADVVGITPVPQYAPRIPIAQPEEFDMSFRVVASVDGVQVLQGAYAESPQVGPPLVKGEDFRAVYQMVGRDERLYWISTLGSRVPVIGTSSPEWDERNGVEPSAPTEPQPAIDQAIDEVEALRAEMDRRMRQTITTLGGKAA